MKFTLDGNELVLIKLPYSSLTEQGWSFDYNVYGMKDLLTDSGVFYQRSVYLDHEGMDDGTICIGFANFNDEKSKSTICISGLLNLRRRTRLSILR